MKKNIKVDDDFHEIVKKFCIKNNITMTDFSMLAMKYFIDRNILPTKGKDIEFIRNTIVSFFKQQEKIFLLPTRDNMEKVHEELVNLNYHITKLLKKK